MSLIFAVLLLAVFIAALQPALGSTLSAKLFPLTISSAAIVILLIVISRDGIALRRATHEVGTGLAGATHNLLAPISARHAVPRWGRRHHRHHAVGRPQVALIGAIVTYLVARGRYKWHWAALYGAVAWLILYGLYDRVLHVLWVPPMFFN